MITTILISVGVTLWLRSGDMSGADFKDAIREVGWTGALAAFVLSGVQVFFIVCRFFLLIPADSRPGFFRVSYAIGFGQALNTFVPARLGDVAKVALLSGAKNSAQLPILTATGALIADRIIDIACLILLTTFSGAFLEAKESLPERGIPPIPGWVLPIVIAICAGLVWFARSWMRRNAESLKKWGQQFQHGMTALRDPRTVFLACLCAIIAWVCEAFSMWTLCQIQGFDLRLTQAILILFLLNVAIAIPLSIGNLGPFEAAVVWGLKQFGMLLPPALAVATIHHAMQTVAVAFYGFGHLAVVSLWREKTKP